MLRIPIAMWTPSVWELGIILLLVFVMFGAGRLPEAFGQLGKAVKSFRDGQKGEGDEPLDVTPAKKKAKSIAKSEDLEEADEVEEAEEVKEKRRNG